MGSPGSPWPQVLNALSSPCFTDALELALACDIIISSEDTTFGDTHARLGVILYREY